MIAADENKRSFNSFFVFVGNEGSYDAVIECITAGGMTEQISEKRMERCIVCGFSAYDFICFTIIFVFL